MHQYLVKYNSGAKTLSQPVFAPDLATAIDEFVKLHPTLSPSDISSIEPKPTDQEVTSHDLNSQPLSGVKADTKEDVAKNSKPRTRNNKGPDIWSRSHSSGYRYRNHVFFLTVMIFGAAIALFTIPRDQSTSETHYNSTADEPETELQSKKTPDRGPYCKSILNERRFEDVFVNFSYARDSARDHINYIIPGTRHKIHYRKESGRFTEEVGSNIKKAIVSEIGNRSTKIIYEVDCDRESIQLKSVFDGEKRPYACYDGDTVVFVAAASICRLR